MAAMAVSPKDVLPVDAAPATSVMLPRGRPPPKTTSTSLMPVGKTSGACLILSERAAGTRFASVVSIWRRIAAVEGIIYVFALCSPIGAGLCQLRLDPLLVQNWLSACWQAVCLPQTFSTDGIH